MTHNAHKMAEISSGGDYPIRGLGKVYIKL